MDMKKSMWKWLLAAAAIVVCCFAFAPAAFAVEEEKTIWQIIAENPILSGAVKDILTQFLAATIETLSRYMQYILDMIRNSGAVA